jgi:hypothetical protein
VAIRKDQQARSAGNFFMHMAKTKKGENSQVLASYGLNQASAYGFIAHFIGETQQGLGFLRPKSGVGLWVHCPFHMGLLLASWS